MSYKGLGLTGDVLVPSLHLYGHRFSAGLERSAAGVCGCRPRDDQHLDPEAAEAAITPATSAIVAVHNFGNPAEIDALEALARKHGLKLIFDAAHGFGALYQGKPVGTQGDAHSF